MSSGKSLDKALKIIAQEIDKIAQLSTFSKTEEGDSEFLLDRNTASILTDFVRVLVTVRKDERDQAKGEDLQGKSDEELATLAQEALKYLEKNKDT